MNHKQLFEDESMSESSQADIPVSVPDGFTMGIDPSMTGTGIIILNKYAAVAHRQAIGEKAVESDLVPNVQDRIARVKNIVAKIVELLRRYELKSVCIENYSFGSFNVAPAIELGFLIRYVIAEAGIPLYEVSPATLKKWASGAGKNAKNSKGESDSKTRVIVSLVRRYDLDFESNDIYDAYALARMAYQIAGFETSEMAYQREAVATVSQPKKKPPRKPRSKKVES